MKGQLKFFAFALTTFCLSGGVFSHSGEDPSRELTKALDQISEHQEKFSYESDVNKKYKHLKGQLNSLNSRLLILRNELIDDTSVARCLKKQTEIDYFKELDLTLKSSQKMLKQLGSLIESN